MATGFRVKSGRDVTHRRLLDSSYNAAFAIIGNLKMFNLACSSWLTGPKIK